MNQSDPRLSPREGVLRASVASRADTLQFVEFDVDGQRYAFPIGQIREIVILQNVTPTPQVAAHVEGVSNLRGSIIPIINLRVLFGLAAKAPDDDTRTIVVNVGAKTMGCTVDMVSRVLRVDKDDISAAPETVTSEGRNYIHGFIKINERLVIILDVNELLRHDDLQHPKNIGFTTPDLRTPTL